MSREIPHNALVVVADGTQATTYRNNSRDGGISLDEVEKLEPFNLQAEGPSGSRPPESTAQETDEATFAKQLAEHLNSEALANKFDSLVLIADPGTLGQIRPCLHQAVEQRMIKQIDKTLTNSSIEDIENSLT